MLCVCLIGTYVVMSKDNGAVDLIQESLVSFDFFPGDPGNGGATAKKFVPFSDLRPDFQSRVCVVCGGRGRRVDLNDGVEPSY